MQNRFKFRVWDKENKKFEICFAIIEDGILYEAIYSLCENIELRKINIDHYEISQCIGLKDKNGKLIYEGDILKHDLFFVDSYYMISWDKKILSFNAIWFHPSRSLLPQNSSQLWPSESLLTSRDLDTSVILGNRWENPELLKEIE